MAYETITVNGRQRTRSFPDGAIKLKQKSGYGVVYYAQDSGRILIKGFAGNAAKPAFYESYRNPAGAADRIQRFFDGLASWKQRTVERRKELNAGHTLKVGDIITNSWGYDQTNVDWYRIVKTSRVYVWLQPICASVEQTGFMSGQSAPAVDTSSPDAEKCGFSDKNAPVEKHKAFGQSVSMKYGSGSRWDGHPVYASWYA